MLETPVYEWEALNEQVMDCTSSSQVLEMIAKERRHRPQRPSYLSRLISRYNRLRSLEERRRLGGK